MGRIAGTTTISVDGEQLQLKGSITLAVGQNERERIMGLDGPHGYKETKVSPFVEVTVSMTEDLDLPLLEQVEDATVQVNLANGKKAIFSKATQVNHVQISPEEGEATFRFESETGTYA
ncbi:phage tail protein [bacterium]|nr:phage tail protein [bacterium]